MTTLLRQRILPSMTRSMNVLHPRIISTPKIRFYSSSSSSSSSTKKSNNTTPTAPQKELHFVHVNNIHPRDLAQSAFYALDRPLLTFGDQVQQAFEYGQNQQVWEEDEDGDENAGSNTNTIPLNNPLSPYLRSSPFHPTQSTISMTTAESEYVANRFLSEIGLKFKQEQLSNDQNDQKKTAMEPKINNVNQQGQSDEMNSEAEDNTLYTTNIIQKRRLKMNKHKHKKLRKRTRALRRRQGKI